MWVGSLTGSSKSVRDRAVSNVVVTSYEPDVLAQRTLSLCSCLLISKAVTPDNITNELVQDSSKGLRSDRNLVLLSIVEKLHQ